MCPSRFYGSGGVMTPHGLPSTPLLQKKNTFNENQKYVKQYGNYILLCNIL